MERTKRRITNNPIYVRYYDLYQKRSQILNPSTIPNIYTVLFDKQNILKEIISLQGDENGKYLRNGEEMVASISATRKQLKEIVVAYNDHCRQRINSGYSKPDLMPKELQEEHCRLFAKLDVHYQELETLKTWLKNYTDQEIAETESKILCYGLKGTGKLLGGILSELDGQVVIQNKEGLLIIENGIYRGMAVSDYRILCKRWEADRRETDKKKLLALQEQAKADGKPIPMNLPVRSPRKVSRGSLPPYPSDIKKYLS